ncbi:MAG: cyclic nucleotide-binding domain-containing protein, partial [Mycobacteriales bacterium]
GKIVGHGVTGMGRIGSSTLRVRGRALTFAAIPLPDLTTVKRIGDDAVRFERTAGGRTALPAPRKVSRPPFVQIAAPLAWTTLVLTLRADGTSEYSLAGASPFPRHWIYDNDGILRAKSAVIDFRTWSAEAFGPHSPWGDEDSPALVSEVESALERQLSGQLMGGDNVDISRLQPGELLTEQGDEGDDLFVLLDGVVRVEVDGQPLAEIGPGALLGERAALSGNRRTASLRAVTKCAVAKAPPDVIDLADRERIAEMHKREASAHPTT